MQHQQPETSTELFGKPIIAKKKKSRFQKMFGCLGKFTVSSFDDSIHTGLKKNREEHPEQDHFVPRAENSHLQFRKES